MRRPTLSLKWLLVTAAALPVAAWFVWSSMHPKQLFMAEMSLETSRDPDDVDQWLEGKGATFVRELGLLGKVWVMPSGVHVRADGEKIDFWIFSKRPKRSCRDGVMLIQKEVNRFIAQHPNARYGVLTTAIVTVDPKTDDLEHSLTSAPVHLRNP